MANIVVQASMMEKNLKYVWSERNSTLRLKAIENLYADNSGLFHVGHQAHGHKAINESVSEVLQQMPESFVFSLLKPVVINNDIGRLLWGVGPEGKPPVQKGMDIVVFEHDKIKALYVFLD
ncbi:nuclear transport factor 2 family protein [Sinomicrobium sp. M5D2P17]